MQNGQINSPESDPKTAPLGHISAPLRPLAVPIESLTLDPANVRTHSPRNLEVIRGSLARFGQQTPIVMDKSGVVRKGNGTLQAARELGWKFIAAVTSDLEGVDLTGYAIADNRSGDPEVGSVFDQQALADTLAALAQDGFDVISTGFSEDEVAAIIAQQNGIPSDAAGRPLDDAALAADVKTVQWQPDSAKESSRRPASD
jgi:ParB-like chromosome segregation protein Spo0J